MNLELIYSNSFQYNNNTNTTNNTNTNTNNTNNNNYDFNDFNIPYADFSLNELEESPNDTIEEIFHYEVEKAIDNGNIKIINNAIKNYGHLLDHSYITWANSISAQIVEEQIEDMQIS
tara:strand:- start:1473 stop:1826 length:354 start_codon:yes stop_codon:yes gene_type:complete